MNKLKKTKWRKYKTKRTQHDIGLFLLLAWIVFVSQLSGLEACDEWTDDAAEWVGEDGVFWIALENKQDDDDEAESECGDADDCLLLVECCLAFCFSWAMLDDDERLFSLRNEGDSELCWWVGVGDDEVETEADSFDESECSESAESSLLLVTRLFTERNLLGDKLIGSSPVLLQLLLLLVLSFDWSELTAKAKFW